jgi:hypothetical protein
MASKTRNKTRNKNVYVISMLLVRVRMAKDLLYVLGRR